MDLGTMRRRSLGTTESFSSTAALEEPMSNIHATDTKKCGSWRVLRACSRQQVYMQEKYGLSTNTALAAYISLMGRHDGRSQVVRGSRHQTPLQRTEILDYLIWRGVAPHTPERTIEVRINAKHFADVRIGRESSTTSIILP